MTTVTVSPKYIRAVIDQAVRRVESYEDYPSYQERVEKADTHPEIHSLMGAIGEMAFAIYAEIQMDAGIYETGDGGVDFRAQIDGNIVNIDVKTRSPQIFTFWVSENKILSENHSAELFVLAKLFAPIELENITPGQIDTLEGWEVEFVGSAWREEFADARRVQSDEKGWNRSIPLDQLHPVPKPNEITQVG